MTYAGFIMGLPSDTPASIRRDIEIIQKELPVDVLEFTMLTPLPGSEDHQKLFENGVWMDPDLNKYDLESVTVEHPRMSARGMAADLSRRLGLVFHGRAYRARDAPQRRLWHQARRGSGASCMPDLRRHEIRRAASAAMRLFAPQGPEAAPARAAARAGAPLLPAVLRCRHSSNIGALPAYAFKILRMQKRVERDPDLESYRDLAITPVVDAESEALEMFELNESSKAAVEKARRQAQRHRAAHQLAS